MSFTYSLRFLIGLAIALAYSYAAFEYKWKEYDEGLVNIHTIDEDDIWVCLTIPPVEKEDEKYQIPITYQEPYKPEFEELTYEELKENLQYIETEVEEEEECDPEKRSKRYEQKDDKEVFEEEWEEDTDDLLINVIEDNASPIGGMKAFYQYLKKELKYPEELRGTGIEGKVFIQFIVKKDGALTCFDVIRGVHPLLDEEALRVIMAAPKWKPGTQFGKVIEQQIRFPILFKL